MIYGVVLFIVYMFIVGMAAGWAAWVLLGKNKSLSEGGKPKWSVLLPLGVLGSFVAGAAASLLSGEGFGLHPMGLFASIAGAVIVVAIYGAIKGR
jgi:uncharacterized membrane protein YeaQ/YmgE (transglycosylase-associated protein family)